MGVGGGCCFGKTVLKIVVPVRGSKYKLHKNFLDYFKFEHKQSRTKKKALHCMQHDCVVILHAVV